VVWTCQKEGDDDLVKRWETRENLVDVVRDDVKRMYLSPNDVRDMAKLRRLIHGC
jgi:hypothetical protein